jgi:hypothetical protein
MFSGCTFVGQAELSHRIPQRLDGKLSVGFSSACQSSLVLLVRLVAGMKLRQDIAQSLDADKLSRAILCQEVDEFADVPLHQIAGGAVLNEPSRQHDRECVLGSVYD